MNKITWLAILIVALGAAYYFTMGSSGTLQVTLNEQNKSGEFGMATLTEVNGKVVVTFNVANQPAGVAQPAHIHTGSCANIGAIVYPLTSPKDGTTSTTTLNVTMAALKAQGPLAMNVHKSASQAGVYVACGDLKF